MNISQRRRKNSVNSIDIPILEYPMGMYYSHTTNNTYPFFYENILWGDNYWKQ